MFTHLRRPTVQFVFVSFVILAAAASAETAASWRVSKFRFHPMCIAAMQSAVWIGGADEMLAESSDGGQTWRLRHQKTDGELLLTVGFLDAKTIYASGTSGVMEWSQDGGETWKSWTSGAGRVTALTFGDARTGLRVISSVAQSTKDGGNEWTEDALRSDERFRTYSEVIGIAVLDAAHWAFLLHQPNGEYIFASTTNSGKTWTPLHINDTYPSYLFVHQGEYWAFGMEIAERQNGGGYGMPLVLHSPDGARWKHGAKAPNEFRDCTVQGCELHDGAIADLYGEKPRYFAFPAEGVVTPKWAMAGDAICTIRSEVLCTSVTLSESLPPRPAINYPITIDVPPHGPLFSQPEGCIECNLESFPLDKKYLGTVKVQVSEGGKTKEKLMPGLYARLDVRYHVRSDGTVENVRVSGAPRPEIEAAISKDISSWVFDPPHAGNSGDDERQIRVSLSCTAFGPAVSARCRGLIPNLPQPGVVTH